MRSQNMHPVQIGLAYESIPELEDISYWSPLYTVWHWTPLISPWATWVTTFWTCICLCTISVFFSWSFQKLVLEHDCCRSLPHTHTHTHTHKSVIASPRNTKNIIIPKCLGGTTNDDSDFCKWLYLHPRLFASSTTVCHHTHTKTCPISEGVCLGKSQLKGFALTNEVVCPVMYSVVCCCFVPHAVRSACSNWEGGGVEDTFGLYNPVKTVRFRALLPLPNVSKPNAPFLPGLWRHRRSAVNYWLFELLIYATVSNCCKDVNVSWTKM